MTILRIKVENVKGAKIRDLEIGIIPNKPSLLVAPNGFGKSSITAAFMSLNQARLKLDDDHLHEASKANKPRLTIELKDVAGKIHTLTADETKNDISKVLDVYVINSRLKAKAVKNNVGGFTTASASLKINEILLVDKIPPTTHFDYSITESRKNFGKNGKILIGIDCILNNIAAIDALSDELSTMTKFSGVKVQDKLDEIKREINVQDGDASIIRAWTKANCEAKINEISCLSQIADIVSHHVPEIKERLDSLLSAYQLCALYSNNPQKFKKACAYTQYLRDKEAYSQLISSFDTTWKKIKPKERKGTLVVDFPNASHISNGQRDSLTFAAMIQRIRGKIGKRNCILIIDEIFDYLDDGNLTAVQYYISNLIDDIKKDGKQIYPIIFTHLNPIYFKNYAFQDQKVHFIDKRNPTINEHLKKLITNREKESIKTGIERHHLHFNPSQVDLQKEFAALGLKESRGKSEKFHEFIFNEWEKYNKGDNHYDPFAVCCYVRAKIEEISYNKIADADSRKKFLDTNGTRKKLDFAASIGICVPEVAFLLGVIYNDGLHLKQHVDNSSPIVAKLENLVIRKMISDATQP
ncbi:hypothetical protein [Burkholderia sp. MSMB2157WGS]|uniref:hypothetical protein n=1 Tax=Burkholderia sp. MSMB2157WGS TaxID=1637928 RepID=UPI000B11777E|nr:hypothetical protein [Burkholderia sp. MSMB2157WGS]